MKFGLSEGDATNRELSLLKILDMNTNELTYLYRMFRQCQNLTSVACNWNTSKVISIGGMFVNCYKLTSLDVSKWDTSQVTRMDYMFYNCNKLTSLDVSKWDTSQVTAINDMFNGCNNLTSLDLSNWDISQVTTMSSMFANCKNLTNLDVSNWDTSKVELAYSMFFNCFNLTHLDLSKWNTTSFTNLESIFNGCQSLRTLDISNFKLNSSMNTKNLFYNIVSGTKNIGMLYCDKDTINLVVSYLNTTTRTIYVKDVNPNELNAVENVIFKDYKETSNVIQLNSPLLEGDEIVEYNGKLCHYHKMGKVVLDGDENYAIYGNVGENYCKFRVITNITNIKESPLLSDKFIYDTKAISANSYYDGSYMTYLKTYNSFYFSIESNLIDNYSVEGFVKYFKENPATIIYELEQSYYEDITPLQSQWVIETLEEGNMEILTNLPTKVNMSYITNVPSLSTLSSRVSEVKESDNLIANLTSMLDDEINQ